MTCIVGGQALSRILGRISRWFCLLDQAAAAVIVEGSRGGALAQDGVDAFAVAEHFDVVSGDEAGACFRGGSVAGRHRVLLHDDEFLGDGVVPRHSQPTIDMRRPMAARLVAKAVGAPRVALAS